MRKTILFLNMFLTVSAFAQNGHKQVNEGNKLYVQEKYDEANNKYRDALLENPESSIINFNIGDVQYKKRNFEEAVKSFEKSTSSDDILVQSKGYYNIGNTLYKMGKLPESILAYKKALELNPEDEDAKYNLEYVRAKLKDNSEKQPQDNQQQQQQEQQEEQDQQNQEQNPKEQQQEQEDKKEEQQNNQEQQQNPEEQQQEQQQEQTAEPKEISKEDAERLLNALQNEEKDLLKEQKPKKRGRPFRGKDW